MTQNCSSLKEKEGQRMEKRLKEEQQYQTTRPHKAPKGQITKQRVHIEVQMSAALYIAEDCLIWHQQEERPLVL
ncbi:hypothetical protein T4D_3595 [Trichinella pseudospiralis]|uniref:Uncharacterized protein n=1 Tax=Trichinella pseudospiralis TaxID=6337 RepID=A0A0V1DT70_TRIPS|nr:hypothetical protein T4D_3595 [Trichinella pseudospiralis]